MVKDPVLTIDKPKFVVKLYEDTLEVDLKEGAKKEFEDVIEAHPALRKSLGFLFQTVIPSDVALSDIESVDVDDNGQLKIVIPQHRDIVIPLEFDESWKLAEKLNELIPLAKTKNAARKRRLPLHLWWPDFYSYIIVGSGHL
ncbi:MAG: hypothetical protein ACE5IF_03275 [Candidatus Bathyarchaeia archaeon]